MSAPRFPPPRFTFQLSAVDALLKIIIFQMPCKPKRDKYLHYNSLSRWFLRCKAKRTDSQYPLITESAFSPNLVSLHSGSIFIPPPIKCFYYHVQSSWLSWPCRKPFSILFHVFLSKPESVILAGSTGSYFWVHSFIMEWVTLLFLFPSYSERHPGKHYKNSEFQRYILVLGLHCVSAVNLTNTISSLNNRR